MKKKLIFVSLIVFSVICICGCSQQVGPDLAAILGGMSFPYTEGSLIFDRGVGSDELVIISCDFSVTGELVIPATVNDVPVTEISDLAFSGCTGITSVVIPETVNYMGRKPFESCSSLSSINVAEGNTNYYSHEGVLYSTIFRELLFFPPEKNGLYTIPEGTALISPIAFQNGSDLTDLQIPDSVTSLSVWTFQSCPDLRISIRKSGVEIATGTAAALYNIPDNTEVAYMFGNPPMMMWEVNVSDGGVFVLVGNGDFQLQIDINSSEKEMFSPFINHSLIMGSRPEDFIVGYSSDTDYDVITEVTGFSTIGNAPYLDLKSGGTVFTARVERDDLLNIGDTVYLKFDLDKVHRFSSLATEVVPGVEVYRRY